MAQPIEARVVGVDKMIYMKSVSGDDGSYTLTCSFELGTDPDNIDVILGTQRTKSAEGDENAVDDATLNVAAHRLEGLLHDRRTMLAKKPAVASAA